LVTRARLPIALKEDPREGARSANAAPAGAIPQARRSKDRHDPPGGGSLKGTAGVPGRV